MSQGSIVIANVYVMMAYAFRAIRSRHNDQLGTERFDHIHDLFAEILIRGLGAQVKRGLHRDYLRRNDELTTIRGRIDVTGTIARRSISRGRLVCEYDEYEADTPHNQALKSVVVLLIRQGQVAHSRKDALRRLLPYLDEVTLVAPKSINWSALTYHRANASYRMLLGACELVVRGLLPSGDAGSTKLAAWVAEEAMSALYERFLREYYRAHHPDLSPGAPTVAWDHDPEVALGADQLPTMRTDLDLSHGGRRLIIDAKYYQNSMQTGMWGKSTVHSHNLYQIIAYTKNADTARDGSVSGLLLYARTNAADQPDLDVVIQGNRIGARTLDLSQPWASLSGQLDDIVNWLDS